MEGCLRTRHTPEKTTVRRRGRKHVSRELTVGQGARRHLMLATAGLRQIGCRRCRRDYSQAFVADVAGHPFGHQEHGMSWNPAHVDGNTVRLNLHAAGPVHLV